MFISIHWKKWFEHTRWSAGYCPECRRPEAIRIGRVISTTNLYLVFRVSRDVGSKITCCDNCGNPAKPYPDAESVDVDDWSYRDGLDTLLKRCAPEYDMGPRVCATPEEVDGFLTAVARATRFSKVDINQQWFPPLLGAVLGAGLAVSVGLQLGVEDQFLVVFLGLIGGGVIGGLLGTVLGGAYLCGKFARTAIDDNVRKYRIDHDLLHDRAGAFPARIRFAVRSVVGRDV